MNSNTQGAMAVASEMVARSGLVEHSIAPRGHYVVECFGADGSLKWTEDIRNLVTDQGLNNILDAYLGASTQTTVWYVGLKNTGAAAAGDTAAQIGGSNAWTEYTNYSEGVRQTWTKNGVASAKSITNSSSKATYSINGAGGTVYGAFLASVSTKSGTTGVLYSVGDFVSQRVVVSGDTLQVTLTFTQATA